MEPNLREFTYEEFDELTTKIMELQLAGREEEASVLSRQVPIMAGMANNLKQDIGIENVIANGWNLSKAVKEYGENWLKS